MILYIICGVFIGMLLYWIGKYYITATYEKHLLQDLELLIEPEDFRKPLDPMIDGCPECGFKRVKIEYVNPIFKTGNYYTCISCGWRGDCPEDDDGKNWEYRPVTDSISHLTENIDIESYEDTPNIYKNIKL